jgi:hypothetical protein
MPGREYACRDAERADDAPVMATLELFIGRRLLDDERHPLPAGWVGCRLEAEAEATRQVELASAPDDRQQPGNPTEPLLLRATSGRLRRPSADAAWDEERKRCADSTALSPRRGKRTSGSRSPAPL